MSAGGAVFNGGSAGFSEGERVFDIPRLRPMLASSTSAPFDDDDWLFEAKWDGYRCLAYLSRQEVYLDSRNGKPLLTSFPALKEMAALAEGDSVLVDGEIVAIRSGRVDFSYLRENPRSVAFIGFDLLFLNGRLLIDLPLRKRREMLAGAVKWGGPAVLSEAVDGQGKALFRWAESRGMEGVMAKRKDSAYLPGQRSRLWLKVKNLREGRFWVVGYVNSPGRRLGSLVVAEEDGGRYTVVGRVSSGLNREYEQALLNCLEPVSYGDLIASAGSLGDVPPRSEIRKVQWVKPFFGVQVDYTEMTPDRKLRHPVFREIIREAGGNHAR